MKRKLDTAALQQEAAVFARAESECAEPLIFGVTDGKAIGTYLELKFRKYLKDRYEFTEGNAAKGIDFPGIDVDMKVTSVKQPQSSCPYKSARQKIFGLGYSILVFIYEKTDDHERKTGNLRILHTVFIEAARTGDYQATRNIRQIVETGGNAEDIIAYMTDRNFPVDDIQAKEIAKESLRKKPEQGYLTISNALQWRLQYGRVIQEAGNVSGVIKII